MISKASFCPSKAHPILMGTISAGELKIVVLVGEDSGARSMGA